MRIRLILSFLVITLVSILGTVLLVRLDTPRQVENFMLRGGMLGLDSLVETLEAHYAAQGNWQGVEKIFSSNGVGMKGAGHGGGMMGQRLVLADTDGNVIVDTSGNASSDLLSESERMNSIILKNGLKTIGYLQASGGITVAIGAQQPLITRLNQAALQAGLIALAVAILAGVMLAEGIIRPIRQLTRAAERVTAGDRTHAVPARGNDELAGLARSFNAMLASLKQSEDRRKAMTADIAHELRTPLAVQRAHLEALQDGIYPMSGDNLQPVLDQNAMLERLVEDLRMLALADTGDLRLEKQAVDVVDFLSGMQERFRPAAEERGVQLHLDEPSERLYIQADADRLAQVFTNLVGNALRYTSPGGEIHLGAASHGNQIIMTVSDNGPGIPVEDLPNIFERLYRADKGRSREEGGSGLGLAIARQLAEAHGGQLTAENIPGGGARFILSIPSENML